MPTIGLILLYSDDNIEHSQNKNPEHLIEKIQFEADCATWWVSDNRLVC